MDRRTYARTLMMCRLWDSAKCSTTPCLKQPYVGEGVGIHYSSQLRRDRLIVPQEHHLKHDLFHVGFPGCEMVEQPQLLDTESMCCIEIIGLGLSAWGVWRDCKKTCTMARISSVGRISMLRFLFHWQPISATNTASCPRKPNRTGSKKKKQTMPTIDEPLGITFFGTELL